MIEIIKKLEARIIKLENHIKFKAQGVHEHDEYLKKDLTYTKEEIDVKYDFLCKKIESFVEKNTSFLSELKSLYEHLNPINASITSIEKHTKENFSSFEKELIVLKTMITEVKENISLNAENSEINERLDVAINNFSSITETLTTHIEEANLKISELGKINREYVERVIVDIIRDNNKMLNDIFVTHEYFSSIYRVSK